LNKLSKEQLDSKDEEEAGTVPLASPPRTTKRERESKNVEITAFKNIDVIDNNDQSLTVSSGKVLMKNMLDPNQTEETSSRLD